MKKYRLGCFVVLATSVIGWGIIYYLVKGAYEWLKQ